jgi:protocatechuate 3,4-dioxygenase beta subunit
VWVLLVLASWGEIGSPVIVGAVAACVPTRPDIQGPFYKPNAPVRSSVGAGFVLTGTVRSAAHCEPMAQARLEFWLAGPAGRYDDAHRATVVADAAGRYQFTSSFPPPYSGRSHIHIRVSAPHHQVLVTQYYLNAGQRSGVFDLVLRPQP